MQPTMLSIRFVAGYRGDVLCTRARWCRKQHNACGVAFTTKCMPRSVLLDRRLHHRSLTKQGSNAPPCAPAACGASPHPCASRTTPARNCAQPRCAPTVWDCRRARRASQLRAALRCRGQTLCSSTRKVPERMGRLSIRFVAGCRGDVMCTCTSGVESSTMRVVWLSRQRACHDLCC